MNTESTLASVQPSPAGQVDALGTLVPTLRAMASNYSGGHSWDQLDADVCLRAADALAARQPVGQTFQTGVAEWMGQCFLPSLYSNMTERGDRLLEEVLELLQAHGYDPARVPTLVDYVFGRSVGEPAQEVGGVMVTLAGYCWVAGLDMHAAGDAELQRITRPEVMEKIRRKQEAKNALHFDTPLPGNAARQPLGQRPLEMRICELRHVSLKPNRPYIFTVDANCANCRADAAYAMGHADTPPAQAVTITPEMWEAGRQAHCDWIAQAYNEGTPTAEERAEGVRRAINAMKATAPPAQAVDLGPGINAIAEERQRQMQAEGFTRENDQQYRRGELAKAATAYVQLAAMDLEAGTRDHIAWHGPAAVWPWPRDWWKPVDARRDLVRAGALIAAQIDLIDSDKAVGNG